MRIAKNYKQMSSHVPMLIKCVLATKGDVCELGAGFSSTSLLHWFTLGRKLVSYETDKDYLHYAKKFQSDNHRIRRMEQVDFDRHWSVVLVDHSCVKPHTRGDDALKFTNADLLVLHDSEDPTYGYDKVYPHYKYRYDYTDVRPHTTVLSNVIDVTKWNAD